METTKVKAEEQALESKIEKRSVLVCDPVSGKK